MLSFELPIQEIMPFDVLISIRGKIDKEQQKKKIRIERNMRKKKMKRKRKNKE